MEPNKPNDNTPESQTGVNPPVNPVESSPNTPNTTEPVTPPVQPTTSMTSPTTEQAAPINPVDPSTPPEGEQKNNKVTLILVGLVVVMAAIVGFIYFLAIKNDSTGGTNDVTPIPQQVAQPTPTVSPTPSAEDVENLDIQVPQDELDTIEEDVQAL